MDFKDKHHQIHQQHYKNPTEHHLLHSVIPDGSKKKVGQMINTAMSHRVMKSFQIPDTWPEDSLWCSKLVVKEEARDLVSTLTDYNALYLISTTHPDYLTHLITAHFICIHFGIWVHLTDTDGYLGPRVDTLTFKKNGDWMVRKEGRKNNLYRGVL